MTLDVLILGGANCLMSSALHELLRMDEQIGEVVLVDSQEEALHQLEQRTCVLMVVVVTYPIARFLSKLHRLGPGSPKTLLIFDATDKFALSHVSKFSVDGLITINSTYQEFRLAIRTIVARKMKYISPNLITETTTLFKQSNPFGLLSQKELDVAISIMSGKRNAVIACELNISEKTVSTYKSRIFKKLRIASDIELYVYGQRSGLKID